jgi:hypothetical protein
MIEKSLLYKYTLLEIAKELIELKYKVQIIDIQLEDGSGKKFIVTTTSNPLKRQFVKL